MKDELKGIKDPRREWGNKRHELEDIIIIGLCSVICCGEDFVDMEEFGRERIDWLKTFLELPNGIPDSDTFRRVFERIDSTELTKYLNNWLDMEQQSGGRCVNIDGKTIRGSGNSRHGAYHVVSAWVEQSNITLGEIATQEKSNEITAIPELLDLIDVDGDIVTIDAMGCQTDIARKIRKKGADYILALKDNQQILHEDVAEYFDWLEKEKPSDEKYDCFKSGVEKCHGRIEKREITVASADWLEQRRDWEDINSIIRYRCTRVIDGKEIVAVRHYISSFDSSAEDFSKIIRGHWSIENQLHWVLDVVFREDAARCRKDNSPLNMNVLRKTAITLLRANTYGKRLGYRKKMFKAALNPEFLASIIFKK